jgi:hypothetical protein
MKVSLRDNKKGALGAFYAEGPLAQHLLHNSFTGLFSAVHWCMEPS